ncbi:MAG: hypothetical protein AMXMBFR84_19770 [Candidatus Hydrogenedentota bacterium]
MAQLIITILACVLSVLLALFFMYLSGLHRYWALGGTWLRNDVIPEVDGKPVFQMHPAPAMIAAIAFILAAFIVTGRVGFFGRLAPPAFFYWANWLLAIAFFARGIGDFRLFGLFKKVRDTRFARLDSKVFVPVAFVLGIGVALLGLYPR